MRFIFSRRFLAYGIIYVLQIDKLKNSRFGVHIDNDKGIIDYTNMSLVIIM